jgi:acetyltransferase-like isoleucine patch superfamily enzyme
MMAVSANVKRAMAITANLNRLTFNADEVRALFSDLTGRKADDSFLLLPPFYTTGGVDISIGRNAFINQNCTFYDLGGLDIADDVMIGRTSASSRRAIPSNRHGGSHSQSQSPLRL